MLRAIIAARPTTPDELIVIHDNFNDQTEQLFKRLPVQITIGKQQLRYYYFSTVTDPDLSDRDLCVMAFGLVVP